MDNEPLWKRIDWLHPFALTCYLVVVYGIYQWLNT